LAAVASRSSLVGALLRAGNPAYRHSVYDFLRGLSRDELECLGEFQGAWFLESQYGGASSPYRLMADFFDPAASERWGNPEERAHKMFVLLTYLDFQTSHSFQVPLRVS
jgi:hypothetical protein